MFRAGSLRASAAEVRPLPPRKSNREPGELPTVLGGGVRETRGFVGERRHAWIQRRHGRPGRLVGTDSLIRNRTVALIS